MTDEDKALVERLRLGHEGPAADRIEAQAAEIEKLREALKPFVYAVGGVDLSREHDENRVAIRFVGKKVVRETSVIVAHFTRARAALGETK
jgi:hypothetical protein